MPSLPEWLFKSPTEALAVLIFILTYAAVAVGWFPYFRIDRVGAAVVGASLMVGCGALSIEEANRAIDLNTIVLLFGMMIVVASLRLSGFFRLVSARTVHYVRRPWLLLVAIVFVTGIFSAFFVNDTICLVLTPLAYEITSRLRRNPVPYLLAVAMSSNIGSVATITGNRFAQRRRRELACRRNRCIHSATRCGRRAPDQNLRTSAGSKGMA